MRTSFFLKALILGLAFISQAVLAVEQSSQSILISQLWSKDGIFSATGSVFAIAPVNGAVINANASSVDTSAIMNSQPQNFAGMTDEAIRNAYTNYVNAFVDANITAITGVMTANSVQTATVNFEQQFMAGTIYKRAINTTLVKINSAGQVQLTRLGTTIIRDPVLLKASYVSKAVAATVPPQYAYVNSGQIVYQLFDKNNNPLTSQMTLDVNGAYDQITSAQVTPSTRLINSSWMPECLIARDWADYTHQQQGVTLDGVNPFLCPTAAVGATKDLKDLAAQYDATDIQLNYAQTLDVIYDKTDPSCVSNCTSIARVMVEVDSRVLTGGCGIFAGTNSFTVSGYIGYALAGDTLQYYAKTDDLSLIKDSSGNILSAGQGPTLIGNVTQQIIAPSLNYTKKVTLPAGTLYQSTYQYLVINPFSNPDPVIDLTLYDFRNDTVNGLTVDKYCYAGTCSKIAPLIGGQ